MAESPFVRVPLEAFHRRHELTSGAWDLYLVYCFHRNKDDGRCDPSLQTLMTELKHQEGKAKSNYEHISRLRSELVKRGWIRLLDRNGVELLVGDFPIPTIRKLAEKRKDVCEKTQTSADDVCEKTQTSEGKFAKKRKEVCEKTQTSPPVSIYELDKELDTTAAAAAAALGSSRDESQEICDEQYVAEVQAQGSYPPAFVAFIWRNLLEHCAKKTRKFGYPVRPVKGQFHWWLENERTPVQPALPEIGASIHELNIHSPPVTPPISEEEVARLQQEYEMAQEEMRREALDPQRKEA